jgi:hypothetical protein
VAVSYGPVFATAPDVTGGVLALDALEPGVEYARIVDLVDSPDLLADALDLPWTRSFRHGFCWGLLVPEGSQVLVVVMGRDGPDLDGDGVVAGRLADEDVTRWAPLWGGRAVRVSVFVEATPGLDDLEVRFLPDVVGADVHDRPPDVDVDSRGRVAAETPVDPVEPLAPTNPKPAIDDVTGPAPDVVTATEPAPDRAATDEPAADSAEDAVVTPLAPVEEMAPANDPERLVPPDAPAAWHVDPYDESSLRWWDGSRWTTDTAPRSTSRDEAGAT